MKLLLIVAAVICIGVRSAMMTGGWKDGDPNEPNILNFAKVAASNISQSLNSLYHWKMLCVTSRKSQIVSGVNYKITFEMGPTVCKKNRKANVDIDKCDELEDSHSQTCSITVWDRPWISSTQFSYEPCSPHIGNKCK